MLLMTTTTAKPRNLMSKNSILFFLGVLLLFASVQGGPLSKDEQTKKLRTLIRLYPLLEQQTLRSLPGFGTYQPRIDTSLIKKYIRVVENLLGQKQLSEEEKQFIEKTAYRMTRGSVYRNASCDSRWRNYAKQAIVKTLQKSSYGLSVLEALAAKNLQLQNEVEAYSCAETDFC